VILRNTAKAIIIDNNKLLVIEKKNNSKSYYVLPGGGQIPGETLTDTIKRECYEEIGCTIACGELLFIREYIGKNHEFNILHKDLHQVELFFRCRLTSDISKPKHPDEQQVGVIWITLGNINHEPLYPKYIIPYILKIKDKNCKNIYLGDVN
jgi:ADP-ribose pyrophosphatase YjhB (NUDIX family)